MTRWARRGAALIAAPLIIAGLTTTYVKVELGEPRRFADRAVEALQEREVRAAIAEQVAVELVERGAPDLVASRPLVIAAVEAVMETEQFARVLRRAAAIAHRAILRGERDVIVEIERATDLLLPTLRSAAPEIAARIPREPSPAVAEIRRGETAAAVIRAADDASNAAVPLLLLSALALALAIGLAPDRRRATTGAGILLAGTGAAGLILLAALRAGVVADAGQIGVLSPEDARGAVGAVFDSLAGGLADWFTVLTGAGLLVAIGGVITESGVDRHRLLRRGAELLAGGRLPRWAHVLRGLGLIGIGALILLRAEPVHVVAVTLLGAALAILGLAEALGSRRKPPVPRRPRLSGRGRAVAAGLAIAAGVLAVVWLVERAGPVEPPAPEEITACNGQEALCERRLDQVAFAGTHNSMAAAERPGWFFANQIEPVPRQLEDGIRLLMLDVHYGIADSRGRVRTDLEAEGTNRNRVARRLGPDAVRAAEALVGRLGLVPVEGDRELFLCHSLCELGATRLSSTLDEIRGFLEQNRTEVVLLFLESSVDSAAVEREFEQADLVPYLAELEREGQLPTLSEMVATGRRLVVFDQGDGGEAPWYHAGFLYLQDIANRSLPEELTACVPSRGTPESPLLLLNHWLDEFPPSLEDNAAISGRELLLERAAACRERLGRVPNVIAVDFYDSGEVLAAVDEINSSAALLP